MAQSPRSAAEPFFSVIIAAYQAAAFIGGAIESALEQEPPPLEVIVGDDGSTDDLESAVAQFGPAVRVVRIEHGGEAAAKNAAAAVARGDFLAFLDADDRFLRGRLEAIAAAARADPELDLITTDAHLVHDGEVVGHAYGEGFRFEPERQREAILRGNFILGNAAIRRSRFAKLGGFDPGVAHTTDWEFCIRLILSGSKVGYIDEALVEYHLHPQSMSTHRVAMARGRLETITRTAARSDLSPEERDTLESTRGAEELRLARELMKEALLEGTPADARRAAGSVLRSDRQSPRARLKAAAVVVAAPAVARLHRAARSRSFATVGDRRFGRTTAAADTAVPGQLRSHVAFGVRWGAIDQGGQFLVRIVAMIALARLLTPREIGTMAFAAIVLSLGDVVVGVGVSDALIQRRKLDPRYVAVAFTISSVTGLVATAATVVTAGSIASLFHEPQLRDVLIAVSVIFLLSGVERTPNDMLVRGMHFRDFYVSSTIATIIAAVVGVSAAAANAGVWALVAMAITESVVATGLAWTFALRRGVWRPAWDWDPGRAKALVSFGAYVAGSRVIGFTRGNADNFAVGRVLGAASLGFYSLAYRTIILPTAKVATILGATAFSVFSSLQDDLPKIQAGLAKANAYVAAVCFPATIGAGIAAPLLIPVVFGDRWTPAVRTLEILSLLGPYYSFISLDGAVFQAVGRPRLQFYVMLLDLALVIPAIAIGVRHGLTGVAVGVVIAPYLTLVVRLVMRMRLLHASLMSQLRPVLGVALATLFMAAVTLPARKWLDGRLADAPAFVAVIAVGFVSYMVALRLVAPRLVSDAVRDLRGRAAGQLG